MGSLMLHAQLYYIFKRLITLGFNTENLRFQKPQFVADNRSQLTRNRSVAISHILANNLQEDLSEGF